jgi:hypothetical protein
MAHPFGDQGQGSGGGAKRPSQTIEGTATEIKAEPAPAEPQAEPKTGDAAPSAEPGRSQAAAAPPPRPGRVKSFFTHCVAGLVGGLVGVGALAYAWSGLDLGQGAAPAPDMAGLEQRLDKLEAAPSADAEALSALKAQIAALETSVKEASPKLAGLADRVAQLEASLKTLADTASEGGSVATAAAIAKQITEAEQRLDAKIAAALAEGKGATAPALEQMRSEIAELKAKLGALAEAELGTGNSPDLAALTERIAKLEASLLEIVSAIDKEQAGAKSAAVAIAFANLRAAVSDGRPYAAELDTIGALAPSVGDLGMLPAYAETGIPTLPALGRSFTTASDKALAAVATPAGGSLVDNLLASAQSLVTIRRIDEAPAAEGPAATLARAKAALDQGDLAAAVKEIETLDGAMREAFSAWLGEARARLGADQTLTRLEGILLVSMSGEGQQQ